MLAQGADTKMPELDADAHVVVFDDEVILDLIRRFREVGFSAFVLPQDPALPFGNTREDILVRSLE